MHIAANEAVALELLAQRPGCRVVAGGTSLIDLMKLGVDQPPELVDVTSLPHRDVAEEHGSLWIDAGTRNSDLAHHPLTGSLVPVLGEALLAGASPQLRNLATTAGNLMQRTRCSYFRDTAWACNKRDLGAGCSALEGVNRGHAILGASEACVATSPSDMSVALMAIEARIHVKNSIASRMIPVEDFYRLPGGTPHIETALSADELIVRVEIPLRPWLAHSHYVKVRDRASYAFALVSAAVAIDVVNGRIHDARVALGGVGTIPWRSREAEAALQGQPLTRDTYTAAAEAALADAKPLRDNAFKVELAKATLIRALEELAA